MKIYFMIVMLAGLLISGCKKTSNENDDLLEHLIIARGKVSKDYNDIDKNYDMAISQCKNNQVDSIPVILSAVVSSYDRKNYDLNIFFYDEENDVLGIGVEEEYYDLNITDNLFFEEYPVLTHREITTLTASAKIPIEIRNSNQRKNEKEWNVYIENETIKNMTFRDWYDAFPDIWISMPDPNKVEVEIYLYDKEGNKSNSAKVHLKEW